MIETDLEILITDDYIDNISERLSLYKELDNVKTEEELQQFSNRLTDRFGPIPKQTEELIKTIRLRWIARKIGFEKIVLKKGIFIGHFVGNKESLYYQSPQFNHVLAFLQKFPVNCRMRETNNKLSMVIDDIKCVDDAIKMLGEIQF